MFNSVFCSFTLELLQIVRLVSLDPIGQFGAIHRTRGSDSTWVVDAAGTAGYAVRLQTEEDIEDAIIVAELEDKA